MKRLTKILVISGLLLIIFGLMRFYVGQYSRGLMVKQIIVGSILVGGGMLVKFWVTKGK